jgi:hypothetical protein
VHYDISTTAEFEGAIDVCISYAGLVDDEEASTLRILHFETDAECPEGCWRDVTLVDEDDNTIVDYSSKMVCGIVTSLSPFALVQAGIPVEIDIKPGSFPNSINIGSQGVVPVAIFSTLEFDAGTVDPLTVRMADAQVKVRGKGTPQASLHDANGDGLLDLVLQVETEGLSLTLGDTRAVLRGKTYDGARIRGADTVRVVK